MRHVEWIMLLTHFKRIDSRSRCVIETHMHADHLSGATRMAKKYGSKLYISSMEQYIIKNAIDHAISIGRY